MGTGQKHKVTPKWLYASGTGELLQQPNKLPGDYLQLTSPIPFQGVPMHNSTKYPYPPHRRSLEILRG